MREQGGKKTEWKVLKKDRALSGEGERKRSKRKNIRDANLLRKIYFQRDVPLP